MKDINISILGFDVIRKNVPATVQEINEAAKDDDAAYNLAMDQWKFHSDYSKLRPAIADKVAEVTGLQRESHEEETARGSKVVYDETEKDYLDRVAEAIEDGSVGLTARELAEAVQEAVDGVPVSLEKAVRGMGTSAPAKKWLAFYDEAESQDVVEEKIESINASNYYTGPALSVDDEDLRTKFALACKEIVTKKTKEVATI